MRRLAFGLYLLFIVSWFLHLPTRVPILSSVRFDLLLVGLIAALILSSPREGADGGDEKDPVRALIWVLMAYAALTIPFVEWPGSVVKNGFPNFMKAGVFYFFTSALARDERRLRLLTLVFVGCQTFRILEPTYLHVTQGYWGSGANMEGGEMMYRLSGAPSDVVINPNGLACVILIALTFWHYLLPATKPGALIYMALAPVGVYALILTGSRSGFLGFAVVVAAIWMNSKHKIVLTTVLLAAVILVVPQLGADTKDRYLSIVSSDTKNAVTAHDRWTGIQADMAVAMRRPLFGHGLGTTVEANANFQGRPLPSHNLYVEVIQETGFVGLAVFLAFMWAVISKLIRVTREARRSSTSDFSMRLANALQVWLAMELIFSFASYGLSSYGWYLLAGLTGAVSRLRSPVSAADALGTKEGGRLAPVRVGAARPNGGKLPERAATRMTVRI